MERGRGRGVGIRVDVELEPRHQSPILDAQSAGTYGYMSSSPVPCFTEYPVCLSLMPVIRRLSLLLAETRGQRGQQPAAKSERLASGLLDLGVTENGRDTRSACQSVVQRQRGEVGTGICCQTN